MSKTVLIILAAVVVLIVIVVLTGMRYLRADDEDDFDGLSADRGRSARDDVPAGRGRARRGDDGDWPEADDLPREAGMIAGRTARGRTAHSRTAHGRAVRGPAPQRSSRPYRRGQDGVDEAAPAGRRPRPDPDDRMAGRGSRGYDDLPRQAATTREYGGRDGRGARPTGIQRDQDVRTGRDDLAKRGNSRGNPRLDDRGLDDCGLDDRGAGDRGAGDRGVGDRRDDGAQSRRGDLLPSVRPRQGRGKRDGDGEWPTSEWDELSDVDYWAEVASDKPLTTTAQPAASADRPGRPDPRRDADSAQARDSRTGGGAQPDPGSKLPIRPTRPHSHAGQVPVAAPVGPVSELGVAGSQRPRVPSVPASEPTLAMLASMGPKNEGPPPAGPADDDPLTSPSFPRIASDDSRSYRRSRSETRGEDARMPDGHGQADHRQGSTTQTQQFSSYPAVPSGKPGIGLESQGQRASTPPGGYSWPAVNGPDYAAASVADPYRSVPSGGSGQSGYPMPASTADSGSYRAPGPGGYPAPAATGGGYPVPAATSGGYPVPAATSGGYPVPAATGGGYSAAGTGSYPAADSANSLAPAIGAAGGKPATASGGYSAPVPGSRDGYPADAVTRAYPVPAAAASRYQPGLVTGYSDPATAGYPVPAPDYGGYPAASPGGVLPQPDPPLSAGYPAGPGPSAYPAPAASGYSAPSVSGAYPVARTSPVPAEPPLSYPGYGPDGLPGRSSPYLQSLAGSRGAAPGQGSEQATAYPGFPTGQPSQFAAAPAVYSTQSPQLPVVPGNAGFDGGYSAAQGYPAGPDGYSAGQFRSAPYEPAGYPASAHETGGYASTDPYALDPYGYPGYRNG